MLLSIEDYRRLTGASQTIADLLAMPGPTDSELDMPPRRDRAKAADLS